MKSWEQIRNGCLAAALLSSIFVLGKAIAKPYGEQLSQPTYAFPKTVPLPGWQFVQSQPHVIARSQAPGFITAADDLAIAGHHYRYLRNGKPLDIEMRYFIDTYKDVADVVEDSTLANRPQKFTTVQSPFGSYALFQRSGKLHLSACITPTGQTTVTDGELRGNQTSLNVLATRAIPWFLGLEPLRDLRCVWTRLSIASAKPDQAEVSTESQAARDLAQAWQEWVQWWQKNYPPQP